MNVHLVDGTYELFRSYYGAPSARAPDGREVGATRGLLRSLYALLREDGVTHVGVAFDTKIESFRNDLYAGYKTGAGIEPELWAQFPLAERAAEALGVVVWRMLEFEADDALAAAAARFRDDPAVDKVIICSPDKDLCQCVGGKVFTYDRRRQQLFDAAAVEDKFGVPPASIPDWLALVGDSADGFPGVPKWGAKSASTLLAHYGTIDAIPDDESSWAVKVRGAAGLGDSLREHLDDAMLFRRLATLREDVPLPESLADLEWRGADREALASLCDDLGETALPNQIDQISRWR